MPGHFTDVSGIVAGQKTKVTDVAPNFDALDDEIYDRTTGATPITPDIDGGSIDGTPIGATTPSSGAFSSLTLNSQPVVLANPVNGQILLYNSTSGQWENVDRWSSQAARQFWASPAGGGLPSFRSLELADLPALDVEDLANVAVTSVQVDQTLAWDGSQWINKAFPGGGTVTSIALSLPSSVFDISSPGDAGNPITASGVLTATFKSQSANKVLASPDGSAGALQVRSLAIDDLPDEAFPTNALLTADQFTYYDVSGKGVGWSYGAKLWGIQGWMADDGSYVDATIALRAGTYTITAVGDVGTAAPKTDLYIDGVYVTTFDWYAATANSGVKLAVSYAIPASGVHMMHWIINGLNASATGSTHWVVFEGLSFSV